MRIAAATIAALIFASPVYASEPVEAKVSVCFTPGEQCEGKIIEAVDRAKSSIRVQAYGFTSLPIIHALRRAAGRGVEVLAILDKTNEHKYSGATLLEAAGVPVWIDFEPAIAHNKIIVIDGHLTIGGSYNYTAAAQKRNAENVTFTESKEIARQFMVNWDSRLKVSRGFEGASKAY
ncbi:MULTISPECIES: phospholipase D family nuclease [Rhizobium]|uniref:Phospholipase D n=1 Tax=Rhizobium tropici TaxID=398 RepID=A0A6P1CCR2_RHITR|nr:MULTISPECIES: phospholipase D family protein [Rhizobium]AGB71048.1 putative endonuclease [Rhizobium tropici CIAT 899]MBB4242359.1 phosphatidylserine/phosphatidylglycerophosphate/cardiolipin synthase-like enzyme [Rhizobium tropici]MBB5594002.1 phosphatidylserine/phosphatidylglycerophosphate/cardiolipin synthase-like enzyme [Rhizobium tropici]MBB6492877.1 phosphatidylserine/phosphatidylglycerophosphate/cardiolipin synthase-like enzyme [Rhizobium tropici]NEV13335.1 phospholipase D family prote